jgi:hypothetical protein
VKASEVFARLLALQYRLDTTPLEEGPEIFEAIDEAMQQMQSLTGFSEAHIQDLPNERYPEYVRKQTGG